MKKVYAILLVYEMINSGEKFMVEDLEKKLGCSRRTCLRYLKDVKTFYRLYHKDETIVYDGKKKSFILVPKTR